MMKNHLKNLWILGDNISAIVMEPVKYKTIKNLFQTIDKYKKNIILF